MRYHTGSLDDPTVPFALAFDRAQCIIEKRFFSPFWPYTKWIDPSARALHQSIKLMDEYSANLIRNRRVAGDAATRRDLLSMFLAGTYDKSSSKAAITDDKYLRDVIMNFIIAGRDTTAQAMTWAVYSLCLNKDVEAKVCLPRAVNTGHTVLTVARCRLADAR